MYLDNKAIREQRLDKGWTQQQLADACDLSMRTIQRVEKDGVASLETTAALCAVFEVQRRELVRRSPPVDTEEPISGAPGSPSKLPLVLSALAGVGFGVLLTLLLN